MKSTLFSFTQVYLIYHMLTSATQQSNSVIHIHILFHRSPWWLSGKESACQGRRHRFDPWGGKIFWRRKWQPTSVFLPGKSHGQRNLVGYSPWGHKKSDTIEGLSIHAISFTEKRKNSSLKWWWGSFWHQQIVKKIQQGLCSSGKESTLQ